MSVLRAASMPDPHAPRGNTDENTETTPAQPRAVPDEDREEENATRVPSERMVRDDGHTSAYEPRPCFRPRSDTQDDIKAEMDFVRDAAKYYPREKYIANHGTYDRADHQRLVRLAKLQAEKDHLYNTVNNIFLIFVFLAMLFMIIGISSPTKKAERGHETEAAPTLQTISVEDMAALEAGHIGLAGHTADHDHQPFSRTAEQIKGYKIHYFPTKAVVDHLGDTYQLVRADHKRLKRDISVECRASGQKWVCFDVSTKVPGATVWYVDSAERDGHWVHTLVVN